MLRILALVLVCMSLSAQVPQVPPDAQAGPGFSVDTATRAWLATVPPDRHARSDAYFEGGYWLILWDSLVAVAISLILLATPLSVAMRNMAERLSRHRPMVVWLYWAEYSVVVLVLGAPLAIYEGFFRERRYDLMNQSFGAWMIDQFKSFGLTVVFGGLVVMALFAVVRRLPRTWHIWGAAIAIVFTVLTGLVFPVFVAPLFNTYTELNDARIRDPILRVARQNGIPVTRVYEMDASRQSKRISANVSGFFGTERITLNDNLLNRCSQQCVLGVMGHEMGHYVMNHVYKQMVFASITIVVFFLALRWSLLKSLARWGVPTGIRDLSDPAIIPLATLILTVFGFLYTPVNNTLVRVQEYEADIFGLNTSREPDGFAESALLLGEYRKLEPGPVEEAVFFDHPSGRTRIRAAMRWKAENLYVPGASSQMAPPVH